MDCLHFILITRSQNPGVPPEKEAVRAISLIIPRAIWNVENMGCGKDLAEGEKVLVIKEITKVKIDKSVVKRINRCVMTEIL